jgi:hypothetical protein
MVYPLIRKGEKAMKLSGVIGFLNGDAPGSSPRRYGTLVAMGWGSVSGILTEYGNE